MSARAWDATDYYRRDSHDAGGELDALAEELCPCGSGEPVGECPYQGIADSYPEDDGRPFPLLANEREMRGGR